MKKVLISIIAISMSCGALAANSYVEDSTSKSIYEYDNVPKEKAEAELAECQKLASSTQEEASQLLEKRKRGIKERQQEAENSQNYKSVLDNCMTERQYTVIK